MGSTYSCARENESYKSADFAFLGVVEVMLVARGGRARMGFVAVLSPASRRRL